MKTKQVLIVLSFAAQIILFRTISAQPIIQPVQQISSDDLQDAEEVSVAINPIDASKIAAGSNTNYFYYSEDHGKTWSGNSFASSFGEAGDPVVTADSKGNFYYAHLGFPSTGYWLDRMVIQKSTDGGKTYSDGTFTGHDISPKQQDKESLVCDLSTSSPYHDNLYMAWTEFDAYQSHFPNRDSSRILFSRSTDLGETWSTPITISELQGDCADSSNTVEGASCATAANGDLYITWSGHDGIFFCKSTDGGKTFGKNKVISPLIPGWDFNVKAQYRCNGLATTLCDVSNSKHRGNIYVVFSDKRNGPLNTDVFLLRSQDGGNTWDQPQRINNDTTQYEQFLPAATIDQTTGIIYCAFYDRRNTNGSSLTDMYLARSTDGGSNFTNYKLTINPFKCDSTIFTGDYIGIAAQNTEVYPIWMQVKARTTALYMAKIIDTSAFRDAVPLTKDVGGYPLSLKISPNPANSKVRFTIHYSSKSLATLEISDIIGRKISTIIPENSEQIISYNSAHLPNGVYYCNLRSGNESIVERFIVSH